MTTEIPTTTEPPGPNCEVKDSEDRQNCGYPGITESKCLHRGCCWDPSVSYGPRCYFVVETTTPVTTTEEPEPMCDVGPPSNRVDCGYTGITRSVCLEQNCCWDDSMPGTIWCFLTKDNIPEPDPMCDVHPSERDDCGHPGIPRTVCLSLNCCWDNSIPDSTWCFRKRTPATDTTTETTTVTQTPTAHCSVPWKSRKQCGYHDIDSQKCISKGCCWDASGTYVTGVPKCYLAASKPAPSGCDPQLPNRRKCGYVGLTEKLCLERNCCWDDSVPGRPKCYRPNTS